jgi:DNA-binding helix-hairpin-helix protein with protein kinase domain
MHRLEVVIGDLKPANFIVHPTGAVALIDCDSVQFTDPWTREQFLARHATPGYTAPETLAAAPEVLPQTHDLFALAVLICQLLLEGDHPFEGVSASGVDAGLDRNVTVGDSHLFCPERFRPAAGRLPVEALPTRLRELAYRGLVDGHAYPELRPTAADWADALDRVLGDLFGCRVNGRHFYPAELGGCLWCAEVAADGLDHYPDVTPRPVGGEPADQSGPAARPEEHSAPAGRTA